MASDLTIADDQEGKFSTIASVGVSKSSLMGDKSYSANLMVWSTLNQFALSTGTTKMDFKEGKLNSISSYSSTAAYLKGNWMGLLGYTWIKPHPKWGTYGYNVGMITLLLKNAENKFNVTLSTSAVVFWTKPYQYSKKITLSPQIFIMNSPINYDTYNKSTLVSRHFGGLIGTSFDYKISKRFGFSANYKLNVNTMEGIRATHMIMIGSRMIL